MRTRAAVVLASLALAGVALAASSVDPWRKTAWSENCGYLNFRDAGSPPADQGVALVGGSHFTGFIWGENIGWINTGDSGGPYANTDHTNFGVNVNPGTGELTGYAWGENVGWINFSGGALANPPQPARLEGGRLKGYAWGENIGWINLDDNTTKFVAIPPCIGDANGDRVVDFDDITDALAAWLDDFITTPTGTGLGDANFDGVVDFDDITDILANWLNGCP
ncbi:MAG TPA: hypothetical protein DEB06_06765 [Phycisphaerales bacterium]|nr:hypothetical protein [Phycisphaerales bacterium]